MYVRDGQPDKIGLIYNHHVYPLMDGDTVLDLNHGDGSTYDGLPAMHDLLNQRNYMMFRNNHTFFTPEGTYKMTMEDALYEDWMSKLFTLTPPALGVDDHTVEVLRRGTIGLYWADKPPGTMLNPDEYVAIDMSKCYYNTLMHLLELQRLPTISLYDRFEPVPFADQTMLLGVGPNDLLMVDEDLTKYGFRTNLINGKTYDILYEFQGRPCRVTAILRLRMEEAGVQRKMLQELQTYDTDKQKKYAVMNGMFGKLRSTREEWIEVRDPIEQQYYQEEHGFKSRGDDCMSRVTVTPICQSRFQVYQAVVHTANALVLRHILHIQREVPGAGLPSKIKIDSLTYERRRLRTPFDPTGERALRRFVINENWKFEPLRVGMPLMTPMAHRHFTITSYSDELPTYSRNVTFIGPPGVGKTYQALAMNPDVKCCFSNKGARRIGGITMDSALGMTPGVYKLNWDREKIAGKVVFVDEAQALRPRHWGLLKFAYLHLNTSFIFALDPDQIPPVEHERYPVSEHPFWGNITRLTVDYRNEPCLVQAREALLRDDFEPDIVPEAAMTRLNVAYTHRTCAIVNAYVTRELGLNWLDPGWYIVKLEHRTSKTYKGEVLYRDAMGKWHRDKEDGPVVLKAWADASAKRYLNWAYCVTIHSTIGETFREPYTIWDVGHPGFSKKLMYTALTRGVSLQQITFRKWDRL
jgi:hypothetical protein